MKLQNYTFFIFTLICVRSVSAQIQWASELVNFSSELKKDVFSAKQVLGKPNVIPEDGILTPCAWSTASSDRELFEFIEVGYATPQQISSVIISENINPGAIIEIIAFDSLNRKLPLYQSAAKVIMPLDKGGRLFVHSFKKTFFKVKKIRLTLASDAVPGFNQIDAIGISADSVQSKIGINNIQDFENVTAPENLGLNINDERAQELAPVITADAKTLYFTRQFHPKNIGDSTTQDIWYSEKEENDSFSSAKNIGAPINNAVHNALIAALPDGNTLLLLNKYLPDNQLSEGISYSSRTRSGWSYPTPIEVDSFYNLGKTAEYCLGADGKTLLMTIQRKDGIGQKDIYVSFLKDNGWWSVPKNLGNNINTAEVELSPFLASDGVTLYFSSRGYPGYGGTDMFVSKRLDDSWTKWSEPLNLGPGINSKGFDAYYTIPASGDFAYYSSSKNEKSSDIYRVKLPESARPEPVLLVKGKVYNAKTKEPMGADISYESLKSGKGLGIAKSNPSNGDFRIVLPVGDNYGFLAEQKGFLSMSQNLDLVKYKEYAEISVDLYLYPVETGTLIQLNNLFFETAKYNLKSEDTLELNRVLKFMNEYPNIQIEISGHTDNVGDDQSNLTLSNNRAKSVTDYLKAKGIAADRLKSIGFGKNKPLSSNSNAEGRAKNRRIELKILKM